MYLAFPPSPKAPPPPQHYVRKNLNPAVFPAKDLVCAYLSIAKNEEVKTTISEKPKKQKRKRRFKGKPKNDKKIKKWRLERQKEEKEQKKIHKKLQRLKTLKSLTFDKHRSLLKKPVLVITVALDVFAT